MIDIDKLERLANRAGAGQWTPTYGGRTEYARVWHADGDAVCQCFDNIGHQPNAVDADDVADFIAAANPAAILELVAEVRALREDAERYQWLKAHWGHRTPILNGLFPRGAVDDAFDAGIDAARKEKA